MLKTKMMILRQKLDALRDDSGIAAIEFALLFPIMAIMFFGLLDLTTYISHYRKVTLSAGIVADLIAQNKTNVTKAVIEDYYKATYMVTDKSGKTAGSSTRVRVFAYRFNEGTQKVEGKWKLDSIPSGGATCPAEPADKSYMKPLMTKVNPADSTKFLANNDIIVTQVCRDHNLIMGFGGASKKIGVSDSIYIRPRISTTLDCATCSTY